MNRPVIQTRLRLFAAATLTALALSACGEGDPPVEPEPPPTPVGTIAGTVTIEGTAAAGVTAALSSGASATTGAGGDFAFTGVEAGTYTVTISGYPADATFAQVTQSATIATDGETVQLAFAGEYARSSAVVGAVVAADPAAGDDGRAETLAGVTVALEGAHASETAETDADGGFGFQGLRAGTYAVTISGYAEEVAFATESVEVEVGVGEVGNADFTGEFLRTSAVEGRVTVEGEGLAAVTVTLSGGPAEESHTTATDAAGAYRFEALRPGDYAVTISGYAEEVAFATESVEIEVGVGEVGNADFTGEFLRTSAVEGRVTVEGEGLAAVTVTLSGGPAEESHTAATDADGAYRFEALRPGDYAVTISDFEARDYAFEATSREVSVGLGETVEASFMGVLLRTSGISGRVSVEGEGLGDVAVTLSGVEERATTTDAAGQYSFAGLAAGAYAVTIAIEGNAYVFDVTSREVDLGEDASEIVNFDGAHARTASVSGVVRLSGTNAPVEGVEITIDGEAPQNVPTSGPNAGRLVTGASGAYTAVFKAKDVGEAVTVRPSRAGMSFVPESFSVPAHAGSAVRRIDFTAFANATISDRVIVPDGGPMKDVATSTTDSTKVHSARRIHPRPAGIAREGAGRFGATTAPPPRAPPPSAGSPR